MRRIQTQAEIKRKKKNNQILVGGVMIALLMFSVLGYSLSSGGGGGGGNDDSSNEVNEMGIDFFRRNGVWVAEISGSIFRFKNLPSAVSDINVNVSATLGQYSGKVLYFVNQNEGRNEVLVNIGNYILREQPACLDNETCEGDFPVKGCDANLIIFEAGNDTEVYQDNNCIFIVGDSIKGTDAFLYKVLGVI